LAGLSVLFVTMCLIFHEMKTNEMGGACGTYGEATRVTQRLGGETE